MHRIAREQGFISCLDPRFDATVIDAGAGLDPVSFRRRPFGTLPTLVCVSPDPGAPWWREVDRSPAPRRDE